MLPTQTAIIAEAIRRLEQADNALTRGDTQRAQMDLLVARNGLRALIEPAETLPDIVSGTRRNAA